MDRDKPSRIDIVFKNLKSRNQKAFIPFITAGFPDFDRYIEIYRTLDRSGADIIEVGVPFSDPIADGPVLQTTSSIALKNGINMDKIFRSIKIIRRSSITPVVLLVYFNMILRYGTDKFLEAACKAGVEGIIIPDLPVEEFNKYTDTFSRHHIDSILLVSLTSSEERIKKIISSCRGFLYCISVKGVTGERKRIDPEFLDLLISLRGLTDIPVCPGFGISNLEHVKELKNYCDGLIIGSRLSSLILESRSFKEGLTGLKIFASDVINILKNRQP